MWAGLPGERSWVQGHPGACRGSTTARAPQPWHRGGLAGTAWGAGFQNGISKTAARDSGDSGSEGALPSSWPAQHPAPNTQNQLPTASPPGQVALSWWDQNFQQHLSEPSLTIFPPFWVCGFP